MTTEKKVLKLSTCGSVDDGKSTLIGRLLYDTHSLKKDQLEAIRRNSEKRGFDYLDFSLATDGLSAEREQGITIDVAHIYFSTPTHSFIIADTPGHEEYTRNMVTGTSNAQVAIILIDARQGVTMQTRRHFFINNLLRTPEIVVAINKMDLADYSEERFYEIASDFKELLEKADFKDQKLTFIPISALQGDNVASISDNMPWYKGLPVLEHLERINVEESEDLAVRFQVQTVIRPKQEEYHDYRAYAGKLKSGILSAGDEITILPSGKKSKIKSIDFFGKSYQSAAPGSSLSLTLEDDVDVSRGDMIVKSSEEPVSTKLLKAKICWMDETNLQAGSFYLLQYGVKRVKAKIKNIESKTDIKTETEEPADQLLVNDLGIVEIQLAENLFYDRYEDNPQNGAFILINPQTNNTSGVGFLL